ncbi:hypothetical protein ACWEV4_08835 [Streptomyces sp. NPDC003860]
MRDRRRRTDLLLPRERQSTDDNNPFAPPPEGRPDQPWQPRRPDEAGGSADGSDSSDSTGSSDASGSSGSSGGGRSGWGSQWSSRQPGRSSGDGFGGRPGGSSDNNGSSQGSGPRWDPTDPAQRRARYALLAGMWAFFFVLFDFTEIALLLGALATYWAISSLRAKPKRPDPTSTTAPATPSPSPQTASRTQRTSAITGLVMASLALLVVASTYAVQLVYQDFYTCERDALTKAGQVSCNSKLPEPLREIYGVED